MTTDIVERLRKHDGHLGNLVEEAADQIERLRADRDEWKQAAGVEAGLRREFLADNERLRAALEPFQRNVEAVSLSTTLGHITREHLWDARRALEHKP